MSSLRDTAVDLTGTRPFLGEITCEVRPVLATAEPLSNQPKLYPPTLPPLGGVLHQALLMLRLLRVLTLLAWPMRLLLLG